jgi:fluoroquinolone resistance protein
MMATGADLRKRWLTPERQRLVSEVFARLLSGRSLTSLGLGEIEGRVDLRGLAGPSPQRQSQFKWRQLRLEQLNELSEVENVTWRSLDLSSSILEGLRLFDMQMVDCKFDEARCLDWRLWRSDVTDCSFIGADLRHASLGAWSEGRGNNYSRVNFSQADFRESVSQAATYVDCDFSNAYLKDLNFRSSSFTRCKFAGVLHKVIFDGRKLSTGKPDLNQMEDVDFSDAILELVEFRGLNLYTVTFPADPGLWIIDDYMCVLEKSVAYLAGRKGEIEEWVRRILEERRRSLQVGPEVKRGFLNRNDYVILGGETMATLVESVIYEARQACMSEE